MENARENLIRNFDAFILMEQPLAFFKGLAGYVNFASKSSPYKEIFIGQTSEYEKLNDKIMGLEDKSLKESVKARDELISIIRKQGLDIKTFKRVQTFSFNDDTDLIQEFDAYLDGNKAVGNGFRSDSLQQYLFDIAANLLTLGYKDDLNPYLASNEQYGAYYSRINGPGSSLITGNTHGNFIFSKTWPERWQATRALDRQRGLMPWWSFVRLSQFKRVYDVVLQNENKEVLIQILADDHNKIKIIDAVDSYHMAHALEQIVDAGLQHPVYRTNNSISSGSRTSLNRDEMKAHAVVVHNFLLQASSTGIASNESGPARFDSQSSILFLSGRPVMISRNRNSDPHYLLEIIFREPTKTWAYDEIWEDPFFHSRNVQYDPKKDWRKIYYAGYSVNEKIEKGLTIKDFLDVTKTTVSINKKYLQ